MGLSNNVTIVNDWAQPLRTWLITLLTDGPRDGIINTYIGNRWAERWYDMYGNRWKPMGRAAVQCKITIYNRWAEHWYDLCLPLATDGPRGGIMSCWRWQPMGRATVKCMR